MIKPKDILSLSNVVIVIIIAGGNLIINSITPIQQFNEMDCVRKSIYHNATENDMINCLNGTGLFKADAIPWIDLEFILILVSILIGIFVEHKTRKKNQH